MIHLTKISARYTNQIVIKGKDTLWFSPTIEKRQMLYNMASEGIKTVMTNHTYYWNGKIRLQQKAGGIGDKLAGESARLYLISFDRIFVSTVKNSNLQMALYKRYVDDGNIKGQIVPRGYTWDSTSNSLSSSPLTQRKTQDHMDKEQRRLSKQLLTL